MVAARPGVGAGADDLLGERQIDAADPAVSGARRRSAPTAVSGSPASDEHIAWTSARMPRSIFPDAVLDRAQRRRVGVGERALHRDLDHLGREAVGVDAGDQHPRRIGLAHPQQQPGALGDPVDRIDVARRARPWRAAHRAARYAPSARRAARPSAASATTGRRRSQSPHGVGAQPCARGIERADRPRIAPRPAGIFDRRRRRREAERCDLPRPRFRRRRATGGRLRARVGAPGSAADGCRELGGDRRRRARVCWAIAGSASASRRRCNPERLNAHCPPGTRLRHRTSIVLRRLLLGQRRQEEERADEKHDDDDEHEA